MPASKRRIGPLVVGLWIINLVSVVAVGIALVVYWDKTPFASAASAPITALPTLAAAPSQTPTRRPTPTRLPTLTPKPTLTPYVQPSNTPFILPGNPAILISRSVGGRPLEVYRFGSGQAGRMIVAGIHDGNEWNTIAHADQLIIYFQDHPEAIPANITLYFLRALNPDGEARVHGPEGRTNDHGVDLNSNFPVNWKAEWNKDGCWVLLPVTAGDHAASEPENVALMSFVQQHKIDALISYHSAALGIFPGGVPPDKNSIKLAESLAAVSDYPYPPVDTGCEYTGGLVDWASSQNIAA